MDDKEIIRRGIDRLVSGDPEIADFISLVYYKVLRTDEDRGLISEFLNHLKNNGSRFILTINDLKREFGRFKAPAESRKLWKIISAGLLSLEKRSIVFRSIYDQKYNNSNRTSWWSGENDGCGPCRPQEFLESIYFKAKTQRKGGSLLTPSDAEKLILAVFSVYHHALKMEDIFYLAKSYLGNQLTPEELPSLDEEFTNNGHTLTGYDVTASERDLGDFDYVIKEESESRCSLIWCKISDICRGGENKIEGDRIFCLYFMPKYSKVASPNLEDFGPKSTVGNVEEDVLAVLKEYLTFEGGIDNKSIVHAIQKNVFVLLGEACSEKGYINSLDM